MSDRTKSFVGWGSAPDPAGGSLQRSPRLPNWILGAYFEGGTREEGRGKKGRVEKGREGKRGGRTGEGRVAPKLKLGPRTIFLAPALWKAHSAR